MASVPRTFKGLMKSKRWKSILGTLKMTNKRIYVCEAEAIMSHGGGVYIDGEGFKEWSGIVGEAAVYSRQQPSVKILNAPEEVLEAVRECDNSTPALPPESELVKDILKQFKRSQAAM